MSDGLPFDFEDKVSRTCRLDLQSKIETSKKHNFEQPASEGDPFFIKVTGEVETEGDVSSENSGFCFVGTLQSQLGARAVNPLERLAPSATAREFPRVFEKAALRFIEFRTVEVVFEALGIIGFPAPGHTLHHMRIMQFRNY